MNFFQHNLTFLRQRHSTLAERAANQTDDAPVNLQRAQSGAPTVIVQTQGKAFALHHPGDPIEHSRSLLDSIPRWRQARNIAVIGGGLGYTPLLMLQSKPKLQHLFILEPSISVFRAALHAVDLAPLLKDRRVHYIVGHEPGAIYADLLKTVVDLIANPLLIVKSPPIAAAFPQWAESANQQIHEVIQFGQSGLFSKFKDGPLTLENLFQNLDSIAAAPGIGNLGDAFRNMPAVIVAAGPSLKKNIEVLKKTGDNFLLIAVDTALESLLRRGIVPHIAVTVDPTALNARHFPRDCYDDATVLLFDPEARPDIIPKFSRRMTFMTDKHPFFAWLDNRLNGKGVISKGNMVSQAGIYAAHFLGCDPIILVGQDLALDPQTGDTHNSETVYCRQAQYLKEDRHHVDIPIPAEKPGTAREQLFWVEGVDGEPVPTVQNFRIYLRMLEKDIRSLHLHVIDATEGGAKIQGSRIVALEEALRQYRRADFQASKVLQTIQPVEDLSAGDHSIPLKQELREKLESRLEIARKGIQKLEQEEFKQGNDCSPAEWEKRIHTFSEAIFGDPTAEYLIEYGAPRELFEFMKLGPANLSEDEEKQQLKKRLRILLETVATAGERLLKYL
ncbi:MAG: motility associated factor glycosyltransferase family protein [Candidatus Omnitrophica bacterium]|nr:motility associated factor glycosyltransferase family protein [Candidatus Omnitrophota bacterium]